MKNAMKEALQEERAERELAKNDKPLESIEDLKGLTADEINRRWDEVCRILEADEADADELAEAE